MDFKSRPIFFYRNPVDFRKGIDGLLGVIKESMSLNPFESSFFVFCCKRKDRVKIIYWDRTGFVLWYKRLEKGRFPWPRNMEGEVLHLSGEQLMWLLSGIDIEKIRPHEELFFESSN